jgi:hypothetical protein
VINKDSEKNNDSKINSSAWMHSDTKTNSYEQMQREITNVLSQMNQQKLQCKAKGNIFNILKKMFVVSSSTLNSQEIDTEKEQILKHNINKLKQDNDSLKANLIAALGDLNISEKQNELIFADRMKLQRQLDDDQLNNQEEMVEESKYEQTSQDKKKYNESDYEYKIKADHQFFAKDDNLLMHTDNIMNK